MNRYVYEFETDLGGVGVGGSEGADVGGGDDYAVAEAALAETIAAAEPTDEPAGTEATSYDDALAEMAGTETAGTDDDFDLDALLGENEDDPNLPEGLSADEVRQHVEFAREMAARFEELRAQDDHAAIEAVLEEALDPLNPDFVRNTVAVQRMLARGDLSIDENGRYVARAEAFDAPPSSEATPDLDALTAAIVPDIPAAVVQEAAESIIDEIAELSGLSGHELVSTSLEVAGELIRRARAGGQTAGAEVQRFAAEEAFRVDQRVATAMEQSDRLYSELAPGADRLAVQQRVGELLEPLREKTGLSGVALAREAVRLAAEDVNGTDDYDEAHQRLISRVQAGLPPLISGPGRFDPAASSAVTPLDTDSYDEVVNHLTRRS